MTERLVHQRTKGPASTPAQRLVELQNALGRAERVAEEQRLRADRLQREYDRYHHLDWVTFGGVDMAQQWADLWLWEVVLNDNPDLDAIFEIGTWKGGFSSWLYAQTEVRGMFFQTYDAVEPERDIPGFLRADVFAETKMLTARFHSWEPCIVLCDGGNKPRELALFGPALEDPRSLVAVHDWGTEMLPEQVPDSLEMVYGEFCEEIGAVTRMFRVKGEPDVESDR